MNLVDKALKLSRKEKVELYYALQADLDFDDSYLAEDELTAEQWAELDKRFRDIQSGKAKLIPWEEFKKQIDEKTRSVRSKLRSKSGR